jgi:hypothetical protein
METDRQNHPLLDPPGPSNTKHLMKREHPGQCYWRCVPDTVLARLALQKLYHG